MPEYVFFDQPPLPHCTGLPEQSGVPWTVVVRRRAGPRQSLV